MPNGIQILESVMDGTLPAPPLGDLLGIGGLEAVEGRVRLTLTPRPELGNGGPVVHGGVLATLLDSVTFYAVLSTLDDGVGATTLNLDVQYLRPVPTDAPPVTAEATVVHPGRRVCVAESRLLGEGERVHARATATCLVTAP